MYRIGDKVRIKKDLDIENILEDFDDEREEAEKFYKNTSKIHEIESVDITSKSYGLKNENFFVYSDEIELASENEIVSFESQSIELFNSIIETIKMKKELEQKEKLLKEKLKEAMENTQTKKFSNDMISITYVNESIQKRIDSKRLKEEVPDIYDKYSNESKKAAYVLVKIK